MQAVNLVFPSLIGLCVAFLLSAGEDAAAEAGANAKISNESVASAYRIAVDHFVVELRRRKGGESQVGDEFMSSFESYRSQIRKDGDDFCIVFSPKELDGSPVFGGTIGYCFDRGGKILVRTFKER